MREIGHLPGERVPASGLYEERGARSSWSGHTIFATQGEKFPAASYGNRWLPLTERTAEELRARAAEYHRLAESATTLDVMAALFRIAVRLNALAERREHERSGRV